MLQSRVDPERLQVIPKAHGDFDYWISPDGDAVRPYGILLKEIKPFINPPQVPSFAMLLKNAMSSWFTQIF